MFWRVILPWLLGLQLALASVPRHTGPVADKFLLFTGPPYGNAGGGEIIDRSVLVTLPDLSHELFLYRCSSGTVGVTNSIATNLVPTGTPLGTLDDGNTPSDLTGAVGWRNSFHWNARQYAALSTNDIHSLTAADYALAERRHWLVDALPADMVNYNFTIGLDYVSEVLSQSQDPSPDGVQPGNITWFDYPGKAKPSQTGTDSQPGVIAQVLADGSTQFVHMIYGDGGQPTEVDSTYTQPNGFIGVRSYRADYYGETVTVNFSNRFSSSEYVQWTYPRLADVRGPDNTVLLQFSPSTLVTNWVTRLDSEDYAVTFTTQMPVQPELDVTDAMTNVLHLFHNPRGQVSGRQLPAGLVITNLYNTSGFLSQSIASAIGWTNSYTWLNGRPASQTNELGLATSYSWDPLDRLTGIGFPDGTAISNVYANLDLVAQKDRLGNWTLFGYNPLDQLTSITNALTNVTQLSWCSCGALANITDALTNTIYFNRDYQSRLTNVVTTNGSITYQLDLIGRLTNVFDGSGRSWQLFHNNQGLVTTVSNVLGALSQASFDIYDRPASVTDANGVTVNNSFDLISRLTARTWTDGISEGWLFATNGLIAYTNRDQKVTLYGRDGAGRLASVTNANKEVTAFGLNAAGQITTLTNGLNKVTTWNFDQYGWLSNKIDALTNQVLLLTRDANGQVTNRWMPQTGNTAYAFDVVGNLRAVAYPGAGTTNLTAITTFGFDPLNRLNGMTDAVGVTTWTYIGGLLQSETGPWTSNTLSFLYSQGVRTNMSLTSLTNIFNFGYAFDQGWRMQSIASPAGIFQYSYPASSISHLVTGISLPNFASISNHFDSLARMDFTGLQNYWGHTLDAYGYTMDNLGLRKTITRNLGLTTSTVTVGYDNIGQITSWTAAESNGTPRLNEQLSWAYDAADNLHFRTNGAFAQTLTVDNDNQLSTIAQSGTLTIDGSTPAPATNITVNGANAQLYGDFTFAGTNNPFANGTNSYTIIAQNLYALKTTNNLTLNLPTNIVDQYDLNGNLISDGTRSFVYNAENQLTNVNVAGQWKVDFVYDGLGRRRLETNYIWQSTGWVPTNVTRFIYDGPLPIQERDSNNIVQVTYTRGLDLSGTLGGAGGIGGLLARTDATNASTFYHADGAGNVTALMDGSQNVLARYLYDPFGRQLGQWGRLAPINRYRFSSKEYLAQADAYHFGGRIYSPGLQRWTSQDPIGEAGGINLYAFVGNSPAGFIDPYGFDAVDSFVNGLNSGLNAIQNVANSVGSAVSAADNFINPVSESFHSSVDSAHQWLSQNANLVGQGLYDYAMGDNLGRYDQNTKGALDAQFGLVNIDANNNILRDSTGLTADMLATIAERAAEQYAAGRLAEGLGGKCPVKRLPTAAETVAEETPLVLKNAANGRAFEQEGLNYLQTINSDVAEQVSIRPFTASGDLADYRVRLDALGTDNAGSVNLYDFKSSATAGFTPNQRTGYPLLERFGGQIVGRNGGAIYPAGRIIPPTPVTVLRPGSF